MWVACRRRSRRTTSSSWRGGAIRARVRFSLSAEARVAGRVSSLDMVCVLDVMCERVNVDKRGCAGVVVVGELRCEIREGVASPVDSIRTRPALARGNKDSQCRRQRLLGSSLVIPCDDSCRDFCDAAEAEYLKSRERAARADGEGRGLKDASDVMAESSRGRGQGLEHEHQGAGALAG